MKLGTTPGNSTLATGGPSSVLKGSTDHFSPTHMSAGALSAAVLGRAPNNHTDRDTDRKTERMKNWASAKGSTLFVALSAHVIPSGTVGPTSSRPGVNLSVRRSGATGPAAHAGAHSSHTKCYLAHGIPTGLSLGVVLLATGHRVAIGEPDSGVVTSSVTPSSR